MRHGTAALSPGWARSSFLSSLVHALRSEPFWPGRIMWVRSYRFHGALWERGVRKQSPCFLSLASDDL